MKRLGKRYPELAGGRWGANEQPERSDVEYVVGLLPVEKVEMLSPDRLKLTMHRALTFWEAFILGRLSPDSPSEGILEDDVEFSFWWD